MFQNDKNYNFNVMPNYYFYEKLQLLFFYNAIHHSTYLRLNLVKLKQLFHKILKN